MGIKMACERCDHTMQLCGYNNNSAVWWCPRCGALKHEDSTFGTFLSDRCRKVLKDFSETSVPDIFSSYDITDSITKGEEDA